MSGFLLRVMVHKILVVEAPPIKVPIKKTKSFWTLLIYEKLKIQIMLSEELAGKGVDEFGNIPMKTKSFHLPSCIYQEVFCLICRIWNTIFLEPASLPSLLPFTGATSDANRKIYYRVFFRSFPKVSFRTVRFKQAGSHK